MSLARRTPIHWLVNARERRYSRAAKADMPMKQSEFAVLEQLAREALDLGGDALEVEYRDGHDEVVAYMGALGREIARLLSGTPQASALRRDPYATKRRLLRFSARGQQYAVRAEVYDNFGEHAFRVELRPLTRGSGRSNNQMQRTRSAKARRRGPRR